MRRRKRDNRDKNRRIAEDGRETKQKIKGMKKTNERERVQVMLPGEEAIILTVPKMHLRSPRIAQRLQRRSY